MAWTKKVKPMTPEQAIAAAKRDLAPIWFNSEPLLAAVKTDRGASVLPLNSSFVQTAWLYAFIDPTEFSGERGLQILREWHRRYSPHKQGMIVIFRASGPFLKSVSGFLRKCQITFPAMCDQDGLFSAAFGIQAWPAVVVQAGNEEIARGSGSAWTEQVEEKIQFYLRRADPGLSFNLPYSIPHSIVGHARLDLGNVKGKSVESLSRQLKLTGEWKENADSISTTDPSASLIIDCPSSILALIAQSGIETQPTKILIEPVDGTLARDWIADAMTIDENGRGVSRAQLFGLYVLLKGLPQDRRKIRLSFPDSKTIPVFIYGIRFGTTS
jgi:hypothetical protein